MTLRLDQVWVVGEEMCTFLMGKFICEITNESDRGIIYVKSDRIALFGDQASPVLGITLGEVKVEGDFHKWKFN